MSMDEMIMYIGIVAAVLIIGLMMYRREIIFVFRKKETKGTIVNWMSASEKGVKYFYPMIEFETPEKGKITFRADERCENSPMYERGTTVIIKYLPNDVEFRKVIYPK